MTSNESTYTAKVFALVFLGACHGRLENETAAKTAFQTILNLPEESKGDMDKMLTRKAEAMVRRSDMHIVGFELLFIMGHLKSMRREDALQLRTQVHTHFQPTSDSHSARPIEERVAIELVCGVVENHCGNVQEAMTHLRVVVAEAQTHPYDKAVVDKFHAPYAWYEIGLVFTSLRRWSEAVQAFKNCEECSSDYSFEKWLGYREKAARKYAEAKLKIQKKAAKGGK